MLFLLAFQQCNITHCNHQLASSFLLGEWALLPLCQQFDASAVCNYLSVTSRLWAMVTGTNLIISEVIAYYEFLCLFTSCRCCWKHYVFVLSVLCMPSWRHFLTGWPSTSSYCTVILSGWNCLDIMQYLFSNYNVLNVYSLAAFDHSMFVI